MSEPKKQLKISSITRGRVEVPYIRICNKKLEDCGFRVRDKVDIEYGSNKIIIKKR